MNTTLYKLKNKLFILIIIQTQWIGAQPTPPIRYVYDTIILRDTIRIKKTKRSILVPLPMKIDVPTIESIQKTATFLPKRIFVLCVEILSIQR